MSSEETGTENNENSLSDVNCLGDDLVRMQFKSSSSEEVTIHVSDDL